MTAVYLRGLFDSAARVCVVGQMNELVQTAASQIRMLANRQSIDVVLYPRAHFKGLILPEGDIGLLVFLLSPGERAEQFETLQHRAGQSLIIELEGDWEKALVAGFTSQEQTIKHGVRVRIDAQQTRRMRAPVVLDGVPFDADEKAYGRITQMAGRLERGGGLPPAWRGWRDATNNMQWAALPPGQVRERLNQLARKIEDREQALRVRGWDHKQALDALTDIDDILDYDPDAGWPD